MAANPYNDAEQLEHILILNLQINNIPNFNYSISYWHPSLLNITSTTQGYHTIQDDKEESNEINISSTVAPHKGKAKQLEAKIQSSHNYSNTASLKRNKFTDSATRTLIHKEEKLQDTIYSAQPSISSGRAQPLNISVEDKEYQDFLSEFIDNDFKSFCKAIAYFQRMPGYQAVINYGTLSLSKTNNITRLSDTNLPRRYAYAKILSPYGPIVIFELCSTDGYFKSTILVRNASDFETTANTLVELILEDKYWCDKNLSKKFGNNFTPISHYTNRSITRWFEIMLTHIRK